MFISAVRFGLPSLKADSTATSKVQLWPLWPRALRGFLFLLHIFQKHTVQFFGRLGCSLECWFLAQELPLALFFFFPSSSSSPYQCQQLVPSVFQICIKHFLCFWFLCFFFFFFKKKKEIRWLPRLPLLLL